MERRRSHRVELHMLQRAQLCDGCEIAVVVEKRGAMRHGDLGNAAVDDASDSQPLAPQIEIEPGRGGPCLFARFEIILVGKIVRKLQPLLLVARALQQLHLGEARKAVVTPVYDMAESVRSDAGSVLEQRDEHARVNQHRSGYASGLC